MTTPILRPEATVEIADQTIEVSGGEVTLDTVMVPYARATLTVPVVDPEDVEAIDPREGLRAEIVAGDAQAGASRTFNLGVRGRVVDHVERTIELELASDEALLMDYAPLEQDAGARQYESSLRDVCDYVLNKIGASLAPGDWDADVTARWDLENVILNPDGISGGAAFTQNGNVTVSYNSAAGAGVDGTTGYVVGTSQGAGNSFVGLPQNVVTRRGDVWTVSLYAHRSNAQPELPGRIRVYEWDAEQSMILTVHESDPQPIPPSGASAPYTWERYDFTFEVKSPATSRLTVYFRFDAAAAGRIVAIDHVMMTRGDELVPYFSGAVAPSGYITAWTGSTPTANNSVSTRTPADGVERLPELFVWEPGVTAWEFLEPITSQAGLRLFCDEQRVWRLVDPAEYTTAGRINVAGWNATRATDTIRRDDPNLDCTGVVVKYRWRDFDGIERERLDTAGEPGRVLVWEYNRPYPGPGAAAAILARRQGAGRVQDVTALANWDATPGMECSIGLPATVEQIGQITSVTWTLTDGLMRLGTSGLVDLLPGSIDTLDGVIDDLIGTIDDL